MKKVLILSSIIFFAIATEAFSQQLFAEKFSGCNTERFGLENDTATAKIDQSILIKTITGGFREKDKNKIRGTLSLQILVDTLGNSCLLSLKNDTNIKTNQLKLKETVDQQLKWQKLKEMVSPVIVLRFEENEIKYKRLGMHGKRGVHELKL